MAKLCRAGEQCCAADAGEHGRMVGGARDAYFGQQPRGAACGRH